MVRIEDIPGETRWEIAAKSASAMPLLYDRHFRKVLGDKYDDIERSLWIESGKEIRNPATALDLPTNNAPEISESLGIIGAILYGTEMKFEPAEQTENKVVGRTTGCSVLNRATEMGLDPKISVLRACRIVLKTEVEALNPAFTQRFNKSMCGGDDYCEMVIERKR